MTQLEFSDRIIALRGKLGRVVYGLLRDTADQQDAMQEAVFRAWRSLHSLKNEAAFETWVIRILINECRNIQRRHMRVTTVENFPDTPEPSPDPEAQALGAAVLKLPEKLRLPVILHYMNGYSLKEISGMLRLPYGTVQSRMRKARLELKAKLSAGEEI